VRLLGALIKQSFVNAVFSGVHRRYDIMNTLMSGGLHHLWKRDLAGVVLPYKNVLDIASGTGDVAILLAKRGHNVTACDINQDMLNGGITELAFEDQSFDCCTIAFGIRNVEDRQAALREMYRVLKPGGMMACLEFSQMDEGLLRTAYGAYSRHVIPTLGQIVASNRAAYEYLVSSIEAFPGAEDFAAMIGDCGFADIRFARLAQGIVALHTGRK
jgi:demethylmenaquinone methyltransferase/2-methoxy-6-polyprenyl-1,4-benzoquinol methylase